MAQVNIEYAKEVGRTAAIISDAVLKELYKEVQETGHGYMVTVEYISEWALEFVDKHKKTDWQQVLDGGMTPLSKAIKYIMCWDDAVFDWAYYKLENF